MRGHSPQRHRLDAAPHGFISKELCDFLLVVDDKQSSSGVDFHPPILRQCVKNDIHTKVNIIGLNLDGRLQDIIAISGCNVSLQRWVAMSNCNFKLR